MGRQYGATVCDVAENLIHVLDPAPYSYSFGDSPEAQTANNLRYLEEVIENEGPKTIAAMST